MEEEVLVFPGRLLEELGSFVGFCDRVDSYLPTLLDPRNLSYVPRSLAEDDPSRKQLIPYVVLRSGDSVYCYERGRKGSESRLHRLLSLGVGGHISRSDGAEGQVAYDAGFAREIEEEVGIDTSYESRIVGLVYDDRTPVGSVHFGVVHLFELAAPKVTPRDPTLADARFRPLDEIRPLRDRFESWSGFVLDHVLGAPAS